MGLLGESLALASVYWPFLFAAILLARVLSARYGSGLSGIPGPYLASFSNLWLFWHCYLGRSAEDIKLHKKYKTKLLRLAPKTVAVSDAEASRIIYGWKRVFQKSRFYISQSQASERGEILPNLASTRDEKVHGRLRRPVANAFAMTNLVGFEPLVDKTFQTFLNEMDKRFVKTGDTCKLADWLQMYAFDIIGQITFSTDFGFLRSGTDVENMMYFTNQVMEYSGVMGQLPTLDEIFRVKNPFRRLLKPAGDVVSFTLKQVRSHADRTENSCPDLLTRFMGARDKDPELLTEDRLVDYANTTVSAGSDTTAIALREIIYQLLTHPSAFKQLQGEIGGVLENRIPEQKDRPITWTEGSSMTYLQACIKESLRHHPAIGQILPREVPQGGAVICGTYLPEGTTVGCNAYTIHKDTSVFGPDADIWRPERWLEDEETARRMDSLLFTFGAGPRVCIGKNIALLEVTKFIPEFFRCFNVQLLNPTRYRSVPGWLVPQTGLDVTLKWTADNPYHR